jgi:uncharacterized membrane protein YbhN (UPF0104 family)
VRGRSLQLLGIVVSIVSVAGVVYWAAHQPAPRFPDDARHWLYLVGAIGLYAVNTAVRSERWHRLLHDDGARPHRRDSYELTVVGYAGNNVLPARGGDAVRILLMAPRAETGRRTVLGTLLAERLLDIAVVVVVFVTVGYGLLDNVGDGELEVVAIGTAVAIAGAAAAIVVVRRSERLTRYIGPMLSSTRNLLSKDGVPLITMSLAIWGLETLVWMTVGAAAGLNMSLLEGLYLVALASLFSMIPSGPAYAGTQDAAAIIGIKAIGGSSALASTYLILLRFVIQVPITIVGLLLLAARYGGIGKLRRARLEEATG